MDASTKKTSTTNAMIPAGIKKKKHNGILDKTQKQILTMYCWCLLQNNKTESAAATLKVLYQIDPHRIETMYLLCYASLKKADYTTALKLSSRLAKLATRDRDKKVAHLLKSRALWGKGNHAEAKELMIKTIRQKRVDDDQIIG